MKLPDDLAGLVEHARVERNLREHHDLARRQFVLTANTVEMTDEIREWALTATAENVTVDEYTVARWLIGRDRRQTGATN